MGLRKFCFTTVVAAIAFCVLPRYAAAQSDYVRRNSFSFFGQVSPNSSHIFVGFTRDRWLIGAGGEYARTLYRTRNTALAWTIQARPLILQRDLLFRGYQLPGGGSLPVPALPVISKHDRIIPAPPEPGSVPLFDHRWSYSGGLNPIGLKMNFGVRRRLQPLATGQLGFLIGTHDIPVDRSSAFNFVAEFGAGLEYFCTQTKSVRMEYKYHHYSNAELGARNPGLDSGVFQLSYAFGR